MVLFENGWYYSYSYVLETDHSKTEPVHMNTRRGLKKSQPFKNQRIHQPNIFGLFEIQTCSVFKPSMNWSRAVFDGLFWKKSSSSQGLCMLVWLILINFLEESQFLYFLERVLNNNSKIIKILCWVIVFPERTQDDIIVFTIFIGYWHNSSS